MSNIQIIKLITGTDIICEVLANEYRGSIINEDLLGKCIKVIDPHILFVSHASGEAITYMYRYTNNFNEYPDIPITLNSIVSMYAPTEKVIKYYEKVRAATALEDKDDGTPNFNLEDWKPDTSKGLS